MDLQGSVQLWFQAEQLPRMRLQNMSSALESPATWLGGEEPHRRDLAPWEHEGEREPHEQLRVKHATLGNSTAR